MKLDRLFDGRNGHGYSDQRMVCVFIILFVFLGHFRAAIIRALTIPLSLLFTVLVGSRRTFDFVGSNRFSGYRGCPA